MLHFLKYFLLALFLFLFLNLFRSNLDTLVSIKFDVPLVWSWASVPVAMNYLLILAFCVGVVCAGLLGAFRMGEVKAKKKELKQMQRDLKLSERQAQALDPTSFESTKAHSDELPSIVE